MTLLQAWLLHYDPVHRGWTPRGIATGTCATNGFFFPRIRGGYHLRRAVSVRPDLGSPIIGAAGADACELREFPWMTHEAGTNYVYRLNAVGGGGIEEAGQDNLATVEFDDDGQWRGERPNSPCGLSVKIVAGGRFELRWIYREQGQRTAPAAFHIFTDNGNVVGTVPYHRRQLHYRFITLPYDDGVKVSWSVRSISTLGRDDENMIAVSARADAVGPAQLVIIYKKEDFRCV